MTILAANTAEKPDFAKEKSTSTNNTQAEGRDSSGALKKNSDIGQGSQTQKQHLEAWAQAPPQRLYSANVKQVELILFTTQLAVMLDSGVVLSDALDAITEQTEGGTLKMIIMDVAEIVKSGENFSKALASYPKVFNSMFISMVKASEASGKMVEMLRVLSGYLNFESETRSRIKGALTYPIIMAIMAVASTGSLMFFVLPRFMNNGVADVLCPAEIYENL